MKKLILACCLLLFGCCQTALAAPVILDGINISEKINTGQLNAESLFDAPETAGTAYVPLRFIAEIFNAGVDWQNGQISLKLNEKFIVLQIGSRQTSLNGQNFTLPQAPYEKNGTAYVPLRFVAQAFDCVVDYHDSQVFLDTPALQINGTPIATMEYIDEKHVMGADFYTLSGNQLMRSVYLALQGSKGAETAAPPPEKITSPSVACDGDYIAWDSFKFKDSAGAVVYEINRLGQLHQSPGYGFTYTYLLHDAQTDKYYSCSDAAWQQAEKIIDNILLYPTFNYSTAP